MARSASDVAEIDEIQKTDYICTSKESERPAPDTLDETLPEFKYEKRKLSYFIDDLKTIQYKNRAYSRILRDNRNITKYKEGL